ncbi:MAG: hypothetical protein A3F82_09865 [Deltaproteobacteria bacterium RIFCSPLOWO2_12_FULL_44_12]|nr:MAG: hypothetical protein A3D98_05995 [Deltaproteobacteria bacterium RIFCSPHIGHO2_12_FULL_44_21]OGQ70516.1 MAG: hypothetical protein A3F82_09865 [Deltaproteobacteria bacterium RIFCSPLOWO2_12_FULL_44_12]
MPAAVPPPPTITPPPPTVTELPPDGGPKKDAGSDLTSALPVTFQKYEENTLSTKDTADTYKLYSRAGEGIGVILIPSDPSMQLSVSLLGESGELLTQTQAAQAGLPLAFQTSTLEVNKIIYVQIKDLSLAAQTPSDLTKKYSLELKPIAPTTAPPPPAPLAQPQPQQAEVTQPTPPVVPAAPTEAAPQAKEEVKAEAKPEVQEPKKTSSLRSRLSQNKKVLYGIVGVGFLVILLVVLMVVRKTRKKADQQAA